MSGVVMSNKVVPARARMRMFAERRFRASMELPLRFFEAEADTISGACLAMARRFQRGGRLLVFGEGASATDAQHVSVEFVHPVLVGKRALPAISLGGDAATLTAMAGSASSGDAFSHALQILGRDSDIALGISGPSASLSTTRGLARAAQMGMLTIGLAGERSGPGFPSAAADFLFTVPSPDPMLVQEVHEMLYHVLWELVHVFMEQGTVE
ncbi:MAG: SIS domain-containing protein [Gemmatimonadaceae bacterium]